MLVSVLVVVLVTVILSLYDIGLMRHHEGVSIGGRRVQCHIIEILGSSRIVVIADGSWWLVDVKGRQVWDTCANNSILLPGTALVDKRSRYGFAITPTNPLTGWDPQLSYRNRRLSFYTEEWNKNLLVCDGVGL